MRDSSVGCFLSLSNSTPKQRRQRFPAERQETMRNSIQSAATTYFSGTIASGARRARHLGSGVTVMLWLLTLPFSPTARALCNNGCYAFGGENTALGEEAGTLGSLTTAIGSAAHAESPFSAIESRRREVGVRAIDLQQPEQLPRRARTTRRSTRRCGRGPPIAQV